MDPALDVTDISLEGPEQPLIITWGDGHVSTFPIVHLRLWCPCAECTDHGALDLQSRLSREPFGNQKRISEVSEVGSYALGITFADGHAYGIYSWSHLRSICPCDTCGVPAAKEK